MHILMKFKYTVKIVYILTESTVKVVYSLGKL